MDPDTSPPDAAEDHRVPVQRPDYFADTRRWVGIGLIAFVWIGYLIPVGYLTIGALGGQSLFSSAGPWLTVLIYVAGVPLVACVVIAVRNFTRPPDRRQSWRRLGWAAACFALGFAPLMVAAASLQ